MEAKIKRLLQIQPQGVVLTSKWLIQQGYSPSLLKKYRDGHWLDSLGNGAMIRKGEGVDYWGAIFALQNQLNLSIHPGGKTALSAVGNAHFLELGKPNVYVFGKPKEKLPSWFTTYDWGVHIRYFTTSFLPEEMAMSELEQGAYELKISSPVRALMECLYLVPHKQDLTECYQLMLGLNNLRPDKTQSILEKCSSVKVNRLFLYLADKSGHGWFKHIKQDKINLGNGDRNIIPGGVYVSKYGITVQRELEENELPGI